MLLHDIDESVARSLLTDPNPDAEHTQFCREKLSYQNLSKKYEIWDGHSAPRQYFKMYDARLEIMRPLLEEKARIKWGGKPIKKLHELPNIDYECGIIGTIFKKQELKPSILKEISKEHSLMPQPVVHNYVSDTDEIILEDEVQRIQLIGNIKISELVNGIICVAFGKQETGGKFFVEDMCFAGLPEHDKEDITEDNDQILLTSGLDLEGCTDRLMLDLLVDYISGNICQPEEQKAIAKIARVVIAGNSITRSNKKLELSEKLALMKELDEIMANISMTCPVDLMPGEFDPTNHVFPQQPLHPCLLPKAGRYKSIQSTTNPYECMVGGRVLVGSSGQNVLDIIKYSTLTNPIEILEKLCDWGHIAPTAPDTLVSHPYENKDPFVMDKYPDIIFAGNQEKFDFKISNKFEKPLLVVSVPCFSKTGICALINLKTLECKPIQFGSHKSVQREQSPDVEK